MAESIMIYFGDSEISDVIDVFDGIGEKFGETWVIPTNEGGRVSIYPYDDVLNEYDESEIRELEIKLGRKPKFTFCFELRRSVQNEACDLSKEIIIKLLNPFNFVVDDCLERIWSKNEIVKNEESFLKSYYYK